MRGGHPRQRPSSDHRQTLVYILGPGHWWPLLLKPGYWICEQIPSKRASALRLGLVTIHQMLGTLLWAVEHPPESMRIIEVPEIKSIGGPRP